MKKFIWLRRPGIASALIPNLGIVHEWRTSAAEISVRIWVLKGTIMRLSTSRRRIVMLLFVKLFIFNIKESNSVFKKSEYSYDQYHWCPIILIVINGLNVSSNRYSNRIDGIPMRIKMNVGVMVQNNSRGWDSIMVLLMFLLE